MVAPGIARLVDAGVINGRRKSIHRGKAVAVAWSGSDPDDLKIIDDNPGFELYDPEYLAQTIDDIVELSANLDQQCAQRRSYRTDQFRDACWARG